MQKQGNFRREETTQARIVIAGLAALCLVSGCRSANPSGGKATPQPSPVASPTPTPVPQFQGTAKGIHLELFDDKGQKYAEISGDAAGLDPLGKNQRVSLSNGKATLYKEGKPASTVNANRLTADDQTKTLKALGGVVVRSLEQEGAPTARADEVTWEHEKDRIQGKGNVHVTADTGWDIPAASFTGDTRLQKLDIQGNGIPATGQL